MPDKDRILLVEDSKTQAIQLIDVLEGAGWSVVHAATAEAAMEVLANELPQLILVDYYLPGIRGDELCRQIRMRPNTQLVPTVILTGDPGQEAELRGLESGADDFISKSIGDDLLLVRLRTLLARFHRSNPAAQPSETNFRAARLLAVDDSKTYLTYLVEQLGVEWPCIETASSGPDALQRLAKEDFDCVLVDLVMPQMDGIEVCRKINELRDAARISTMVLMLTAKEGNECLSDALEAGADDFVGKSSDIIVVKGRVRALLRRKFYEDEHRRRLSAELRARELKAEQERMQREAAELAARTQLLTSVLEHIPHRVFWKDKAGVYLGCNENFAREAGFHSSSAIVGKTDHDLSWPDQYADMTHASDREVMNSGIPILGREEILTMPDGSHTCLLSGRVPLRGPQGDVIGLLGLQVDISDQKRVEDELRLARDQAEKATRARSEFLANMSHELRTPLNGVIGMVDLLLQTTLDTTQKRFASLARRSGESLLTLINDVLDFSKIDAGKLDIVAGDFHLHHAAEEVIEMLAQKAAQKKLELACHADPAVPAIVRGDRDRLRQILMNLVNNAVKFTQQGSIVLRLALENRTPDLTTVRFSVSDTGIGIPPDRIDRLFKAFSQADSSTTRNYGGTGLGLAISKQLVELMGGAISVQSAPGEGSTFTFTVPFTAAQDPADEPPTSSPPAFRVLVVDDNAVQRNILQQQVESWRFEAAAAPDGHSAIDALTKAARNRAPFRIAIIDNDMPGMTGLELGAAIKANPNIRSTVLMLMLSLDEDADDPRIHAAGFASHITKPVCQSRLFDAIMNAIAADESAHETHTPSPQPHETVPHVEPVGLRVLIAEDNEINQIVAQEILSRAGYNCQVVATGQDAVDSVQNEGFDIVLMDCHMPLMDGFEATRQIRAREEDEQTSKHTVIIALTANAMVGDQERCIQAGMDAYCSKPINPASLLDTIAVLLKRRQTTPTRRRHQPR